MEHWKDIIGYEGLYQVSDLGRVKSLNYNKTGRAQIMCGRKNWCGYLQVNLCKDGGVKRWSIHRLVAQAFIPNPDNLPQVNHKDECKTNNIVSNLEYCDNRYNTNYGTHNERVSKARRNNPNQSKQVYQYTKSGVLVRLYPSVNEAGRQTGYNIRHISDCCLGRYNHHKGFIWSYTPINKDISLF